MGFFTSKEDEANLQNAHAELIGAPHKAHLSHELLAAAAAYEAAKAWEQHEQENGKQPSHKEAKAWIAAIIAAFVDRTVETKGLDYIDRQRAIEQAERRAREHLDSNYDDTAYDY